MASVPLRLADSYFVRPSPDGRFVAYPIGDDVAFFDIPSGQVTATVTQGTGYRRRANAQWHPDGVHFAAATDGEIRVWDARTGRVVVRARPAGRLVSALDYSTDGSRLVIGELSGQVTMLDSADLTPVGRPARARPSGPRDRIGAGQPDGHRAHGLRERIGVLGRLQPAVGEARPGDRATS